MVFSEICWSTELLEKREAVGNIDCHFGQYISVCIWKVGTPCTVYRIIAKISDNLLLNDQWIYHQQLERTERTQFNHTMLFLSDCIEPWAIRKHWAVPRPKRITLECRVPQVTVRNNCNLFPFSLCSYRTRCHLGNRLGSPLRLLSLVEGEILEGCQVWKEKYVATSQLRCMK